MTQPKLLKQQPFRNKTALICGGSKGIGRATAAEIVALGGSVALLARGAEVLAEAEAALSPLARDSAQFIETLACDATDMDTLRPLIDDLVARRGAPHVLINAVGFAYPQYVEKLTLDDFERAMHVNYYGQLVPILALLPHLIAARRGHIANVSSMMGYFGFIGYAAYAPTKFAIVGLSEVLRHELKPHHIDVSVLYPPDTDTPGFEHENRTKPSECATISESAKLMTATQVAEAFVEGLLKKRFAILPGEALLVQRLYRYAPGLIRWFLDWQHRQARKALGKA